MSGVVIPRWTFLCEECGTRITSIDTLADAEWFAAEHNKERHPADVEIGRQS